MKHTELGNNALHNKQLYFWSLQIYSYSVYFIYFILYIYIFYIVYIYFIYIHNI